LTWRYQTRLDLAAPTDPWLFVESRLTDPLARLRLTIALDTPREVSRIYLYTTVLISAVTVTTLIYYDIALVWIGFSVLGPLSIHVLAEQFVRNRVNTLLLIADSHLEWRLVRPNGAVQLVVLSQCIKNMFGYYLILKPLAHAVVDPKTSTKSLGVMIWRQTLDRQDAQAFRYFSILTNWQMRQGDRLQSFGGKV